MPVPDGMTLATREAGQYLAARVRAQGKKHTSQIIEGMKKAMQQVFNQVITNRWAMYHGDCIEVLKGITSDSTHYGIFSPPFASLYTYSNSERDMGNCKEDDFLLNMGFLVAELYRVMMPGRLLSFHCMDIPAMKERDGYIGVKDFPGGLIRIFQSVGFIYHSRVTIWKDPLVEVTRTKALGLLHKQIQKDSSLCRQGLPDYLITMRKPGVNPEPVSHPDGFTSFVGENEPDAPKVERPTPGVDAYACHKPYNLVPVYSHQVWRRYASPVWMDIKQSRTLNRKPGRDEKDERHICPLQLDVIERAIHLWTNPNDIVLSPFAGIGSEIYTAIRMRRRGLGIELKGSYYQQAILNCQTAESETRLEEPVEPDDLDFLD